MSIRQLTSRESVLKALAEFDRLGREAFLKEYGFGPSIEYYVEYEGRLYDSKAIAGVAYSFQHPDRSILRARNFSGGEKTVQSTFERLGFKIVRVGKDSLTIDKGQRNRNHRVSQALQELETTDGAGAPTVLRKEQRLLRAALFGEKGEAQCSMCGRTFPTGPLIWCAHIKPRAACAALERVNPHVVAAMCKLGCDDLFEHGYIYVDDSGSIRRNIEKFWSPSLNDYFETHLSDKVSSAWNPNAAVFFGWHRKNLITGISSDG